MPTPAHPSRPRLDGGGRINSNRTTSSRATTPDDDDDLDAITPAPAPVSIPHPHDDRPHRRPVSRASSSSNADVSHLDLSSGAASCFSGSEFSDHHHHSHPSRAPGAAVAAPPGLEEEQGVAGIDSLSLWRRMLAAQRVFRCYNSARMSAALEDEELQSRVPSRACLDLLNDSIVLMPEDEREQVRYFIQHGEVKPTSQQKRKRMFWTSPRRRMRKREGAVHC